LVLAAIGPDVLAGPCRKRNNIVRKGLKSPAFSCLETTKSVQSGHRRQDVTQGRGRWAARLATQGSPHYDRLVFSV